MEELIAKRYIKAIKASFKKNEIKKVGELISVLAKLFTDSKFVEVLNSPNVKSEQKLEILLEAVKSVKSNKVNNFIKLLIENNRIDIIPAIDKEMKKDLAISTKKYIGVIYSNSDLDQNVIKDLSNGLSKKFDSTISLNFIKDNFNGIKVDVEDLGVEINFSKDRINAQMIEHIVKAI